MEHDQTTTASDRRADVLERLFARGTSPRTVEILLPGWESLVTEVLRRRRPDR